MSVVTVTDRNLKYDYNLISNLKTEKTRVELDNDSCILITGEEGAGKTTMACYIAYYLGWNKLKGKSNFSLDWICFTLDQLKECINKAEPEQTILLDEFVLMALSTDALTSMQKQLVKMFTTVRYKRLKYIMVIPSIFMLGSYFATHRTRALVHCYSPNGLLRGFFRFYNKPEKHYLYNFNKKTKTYRGAKYSFAGMYYIKSMEEVGINKKDYEKKKTEAVLSIDQTDEHKTNKTMVALYNLIEYIKTLQPDLSLKELTVKAKLGISYTYLRNMLVKAKENQPKEQLEDKKLELIMPYEKDSNGELQT